MPAFSFIHFCIERNLVDSNEFPQFLRLLIIGVLQERDGNEDDLNTFTTVFNRANKMGKTKELFEYCLQYLPEQFMVYRKHLNITDDVLMATILGGKNDIVF